MTKKKFHEPVMVREILEALHIKKGFKYIDATLGTGGHSLEILKLGGQILGIEKDPSILEIAKERLKAYPTPKLVLGDFVNIDRIAKEFGFDKVSAVLFDLGVSNLHLTDSTRGFSFQNPNSPLDMRIDPDVQGVKASDLVNALDKTQLTNLFARVMKYPDAKLLASRIIKTRPLTTVGDFLLVLNSQWLMFKKKKLHPATLPMLALRIAVNNELENLEEALPKAYKLIEKGGTLAVISFHSKEDALVKRFFGMRGKLILPSSHEIAKNPSARSAKLRVLTRK